MGFVIVDYRFVIMDCDLLQNHYGFVTIDCGFSLKN